MAKWWLYIEPMAIYIVLNTSLLSLSNIQSLFRAFYAMRYIDDAKGWLYFCSSPLLYHTRKVMTWAPFRPANTVNVCSVCSPERLFAEKNVLSGSKRQIGGVCYFEQRWRRPWGLFQNAKGTLYRQLYGR